MTVSAKDLRAQWEALELELLVPAKLANDDFAAILLACTNPMNNAFREQLPLTVARFKKTVQEDIMKHEDDPNADADLDCLDPANNALGDAEEKYKGLYQTDINKINQVLFDAGCMDSPDSTTVELNLNRQPRIDYLHYDEPEKSGDFQPIYVARIGALPTLCISGKDQLRATADARNLIETAQMGYVIKGYAPARNARQELCKRKILTPLPLGNVILMLASSRGGGTLHASSPVPPEGAFSAFFHTYEVFSS